MATRPRILNNLPIPPGVEALMDSMVSAGVSQAIQQITSVAKWCDSRTSRNEHLSC